MLQRPKLAEPLDDDNARVGLQINYFDVVSGELLFFEARFLSHTSELRYFEVVSISTE